MKCELFSVRANKSDVEILDSKITQLAGELKKNGCNLLYKTEIEPYDDAVEQALKNSLESSDKPELIIVANALNTKDRASFIRLFEQSIIDADIETGNDTVIHSLGDFGCGYPAYYFQYYDINVIVLPQLSLCQADIVDLSLLGISKIKRYTKVETNRKPRTDDEEISGIESNELIEISKEAPDKSPQKKKSFWKSVFPQKGDRTSVVVSKILVIVFTLVFLVSAGMLVNETLIKSMGNQNKTETLKKLLFSDSNSQAVPTKPYGPDAYDEVDLRSKNWDEIQKINPDIKGWIRVKNTEIDYPVLHSEEMVDGDFYYLYRNYDREYTKYGSIFIDPRTADNLNSRAMLLHGHHMLDGSMFASLEKYGTYSGSLDAYKESPIITIETPQNVTKWQIFAVVKTTVNLNDSNYFDYADTRFADDGEFMEYVYKAKIRSLFNIPVPINENDNLLMLSTCSYEYDNFRTVVFARELREGESTLNYVNNASVNNNPLWPDDYYNNTGASRVSFSDFETAYNNGEISWYDGKLYQ